MSTTTTDLAVREDNAPAQAAGAALAIRSGQTTFDEFQNAALNQLGLRNASNADRAVFLHQCQRTGLDPFAKQVYMIERGGKWTIQTGIDGWRVIRTRAERREGVRARLGRALFYDGNGNEHKVWVSADAPAACSITLTIGESEYTSTLLFREYAQTDAGGKPISQWKTRGAHMLEKCTEADVYRKAFPQDFSGIYLDDAMPDADAAPVRQRTTADAIRARNPQTVTSTVVTPDASPAGEQPPPALSAASPAPPAGPAGEAPRKPQLATSGQRGFVQRQFERLGIGADEKLGTRLAVLSHLTRREVTDEKELTGDEARKVKDTLEGFGDDGTDLDGLLAEIALADDPRGDGEPGE